MEDDFKVMIYSDFEFVEVVVEDTDHMGVGIEMDGIEGEVSLQTDFDLEIDFDLESSRHNYHSEMMMVVSCFVVGFRQFVQLVWIFFDHFEIKIGFQRLVAGFGLERMAVGLEVMMQHVVVVVEVEVVDITVVIL
jgi:hypothetical protein